MLPASAGIAAPGQAAGIGDHEKGCPVAWIGNHLAAQSAEEVGVAAQAPAFPGISAGIDIAPNSG